VFELGGQKKKRPRTINYTEVEDTCLVRAWSQVTVDPVTFVIKLANVIGNALKTSSSSLCLVLHHRLLVLTGLYKEDGMQSKKM
jgi:hypothetical protein